MAYKPTGYKPGRPRKGEIRPETPGGKASEKWRKANYERALELGRASNERFRESSPYRWAEIQRDYRLRKKGWGTTKLIGGNGAVLARDVKPGTVINAQTDDTPRAVGNE
jgi:hypothetical protein